MRAKRYPLFRAVWWTSNGLLAVALASMAYSGIWEYSVRQYLKGFSDAIVPETATAQQKTEDILNWMRNGPPRSVAEKPDELSLRDPQNTLNYQQLLAVCGTATNAFLNLARSSGLETRRLLLVTPDNHINHVVAEVLIDDRFVVVDASYRVMLQDAQGRFLTRKDLQDPKIFHEATGNIPNYLPEYTYERFTHLHLARLPLKNAHLRAMLNSLYAGWDDSLDWSLLLERESFFFFFTSSVAVIFFLVLRIILGWMADHRLRVPRFHFREHLIRASAAFFSTPEIK